MDPFSDNRIFKAAQQAPSVFNTQPWVFWIRADNRAELRAAIGKAGRREPARWLRSTDDVARELVISCGAALFNLRMAVRVTGHDLATWLLPDPEGDPTLLAAVEIVTSRVHPPTDQERELYDAIWRRHTYRGPFTGRPVPASILTGMEFTAAREQGRLRVLFPFQARRWVRAAWEAQEELLQRPYRDELYQWGPCGGGHLGVPQSTWGPQPESVPAPVRSFTGSWADRRPLARFESHPQLLSLATEADRPLDWLRAGQALQRALLTATRYGVAASFLTQPLELADHRLEWELAHGRREEVLTELWRQRSSWPGTFHEKLQMVIRVGYPAYPAPLAPREVPDVVDLRGHPAPGGLPTARDEPFRRWLLHGRLPA